MRLYLGFLLILAPIAEKAWGLPVPNLRTTVFRKRSVGIIDVQRELRGGDIVDKGDQGVLRRFPSSSLDSRMPSLFNSDEAEYTKFSACLAATEGLRRMRDQALMELKASGGSPDRERKIADQYQANSGRVLRAMGMSVDRFNELGREISRDDKLKDRVRTGTAILVVVIG